MQSAAAARFTVYLSLKWERRRHRNCRWTLTLLTNEQFIDWFRGIRTEIENHETGTKQCHKLAQCLFSSNDFWAKENKCKQQKTSKRKRNLSNIWLWLCSAFGPRHMRNWLSLKAKWLLLLLKSSIHEIIRRRDFHAKIEFGREKEMDGIHWQHRHRFGRHGMSCAYQKCFALHSAQLFPMAKIWHTNRNKRNETQCNNAAMRDVDTTNSE